MINHAFTQQERQRHRQEEIQINVQQQQQQNQIRHFQEPLIQQNKDEFKEKFSRNIAFFRAEFQEAWDTFTVKKRSKIYKIENIANEEVTKKRSNTALDFMDCLREWNETKDEELTTKERVEMLFRLDQSAQNYRDMHDSWFHWSGVGGARFEVSKKIKEMTSSTLSSMLTEEEKKSIYDNEGADSLKSESPKVIEEKLKKAASAYKNYCAEICNSSMAYMPGGEMLSRKLLALRANERLIKLYRDAHKKTEDRDPEIDAYIKEYEECLTWEKVLDLTRQKQESLEDVIDNHLAEEGEIEKVKEEDKFKPKDSNEGLSKEQRVGIEDVDNWLLRNFQKGINKDADMVNSLLSLPKRERLHIYYLVENEHRRKTDVTDVWIAQSYTPNLVQFKKKIIANKAMFWKRISGDHIYSFKLSEAMQVTKAYKKDIKLAAEATIDQEQLVKNVNESMEPGTKSIQENLRIHELIKMRAHLEELRKSLLAQAEAKTPLEKKRAEADVNQLRNACGKEAEELLKRYSETNNPIQKGNVHVAAADSVECKVDEGVQFMELLASLPNTFYYKLGDGQPVVLAQGITGLIGIFTGIITMKKGWASYSEEDKTERVLGLASSITKTASGGLAIAGLASESMASVAESALTAAAVIGVAISAGVTIAQGVVAGKMKYHGKRATDYFAQKRKLKEKEAQSNKELKRELKYEKNMVKLQEALKERQENKAVISAGVTGTIVASILFPPMAITTLVVGIIGGVQDYKHVENLRTALFDNFFNMEKLTSEVVKQRFKKSRVSKENPPVARVKDALRKRVAARAGFNSVKTATIFICSKFARLVRDKLFGNGVSNEEKAGYKTFVKSLGLRYDEKKQLPDENVLVRKMAAL